jgi:hypothetical protein
MTFTVVYDANVLYPNTLRDLLIRIAQSGTVQAKWTNAMTGCRFPPTALRPTRGERDADPVVGAGEGGRHDPRLAGAGQLPVRHPLQQFLE